MTLEESFARLVINTARIADALEALASSQGIVSEPPDVQAQLDLEPPGDNSHKKPPAIKVSKKKFESFDEAIQVAKKKKKKKNTKEKVVGKTDDEPAEYTLKDVRGLLHKLQEQENQAKVKSMLKKFSASTLGQVDEKKYTQLAEAIEAELDE